MQISISFYVQWFVAVAQQCTENFKDTVSTNGNKKGQNTTVETRLIPSMRFTCNGTIIAFTVAGMVRIQNGTQDPKIQVWRENKAQCGSYQKPVSEIVVNESSCSKLTPKIPGWVFHCALLPVLQVSVKWRHSRHRTTSNQWHRFWLVLH